MKKNVEKAIVSGLIAVFVLSLLSGIVPLNDFNLVQPVSATSTKKAAIHINNTGGSVLTDYQVNLNITHTYYMNSNFSDLRVKNDTAGMFMPYWIEDKVDGNWCSLWFNATSIPASAWCNDTYYLYYGNASASSASNGGDTFEFFDDFADTSLTLDLVKDSVEVSPTRYNALNKGDVDQDGIEEVIIIGVGNTLKIYNFNGTDFVLETSQTTSYAKPETVEIADIDNDGTTEIVTAGYTTGTGFIDIWTWNGTTAVKKHTTNWATSSAVFSLGLYPDGNEYRIVVDYHTATGGGVRVYNYNLTTYDEYTWTESSIRVISEPMGIGDVDNDGTTEFIISGHNSSYKAVYRIFNWTSADGISLESGPNTVDTGYDCEFRGSQVYDIDGDGSDEIIFEGYTKQADTKWYSWLRIYSNDFASVEKDEKWTYEDNSFATYVRIFNYDGGSLSEISICGYVDNQENFIKVFNWDGTTLSTLFDKRLSIPGGYAYAPTENHVIHDFDNDGKYEVITTGYTETLERSHKQAFRYDEAQCSPSENWDTTGTPIYNNSIATLDSGAKITSQTANVPKERAVRTKARFENLSSVHHFGLVEDAGGSPLVLFRQGEVGGIDVGSSCIDRNDYCSANYTYINKANPVNADGTLTNVCIYMNQTANVKIGVFNETSTDTLKCRDAHNAGSLAAGSHNITVSMIVKTGDYIGIYGDVGHAEYGNTDGLGTWYYNGDTCTVDVEQNYSSAGTTSSISLYGTFSGAGHRGVFTNITIEEYDDYTITENWATYEIRALNADIRYLENGVEKANSTQTYGSNEIEIAFHSWIDGKIESDWVLVRKYASPEPIASLGNEQPAQEQEGDCTTPDILSLTNSTPGVNNVTILWTTNQSADNRVKYSNVSSMNLSWWSYWKNDTTVIEIDITGLDSNTTYYYQAWSYNGTNSSCLAIEPEPQPYNNFTTQSSGGAYNITLSADWNGWNIIGWTDTTKTARYIGNLIGGNCTWIIERNKTTGNYVNHNMGGPESENNFAIEKGWGYYVQVSAETKWERDN